MRTRKIVLNALQDRTGGSGISMMVRELFSRYTAISGEKCEVIVSGDNPHDYSGRGASIVRAPLGDGDDLKRMVFLTFRMGLKYCRKAALLTSDAQIPLFLPFTTKVYPVVTDLSMFRRPQDFRRSRVILWKAQYRMLRRRADTFFAISEFTAGELAEILHIPREKIRIAYCACPSGIERVTDEKELRRVKEKYGLPDKYVFFAGNDNYRKNFANMIAAFCRIKEETGMPHGFVLAGKAFQSRDVREFAEKAQCGIHMIGYAGGEDISALYSGADAVLYPSLYEGFGIPILEAQRCGTPVLAAEGSSLKEAGGEGALYADPQSVDSIAKNLRRILFDEGLRAELIRKGYENEKRFSWDASAKIIRDAIEGNK